MRQTQRPILILVIGLPASGKTVLSQKLADRLNLPLIAKDGIKERLFDGLGWSDRDWSMKLGRLTYELLYYFIARQLQAGVSLIVESPFDPEHANPRLQDLQVRYGFTCVQVLCHTDGEVLLKRFKQRERHPGQDKAEDIPGFEARLLQGKDEPLDLEGGIIEVDTTDFDTVDDRAIAARIAQLIERA